jgi:hypothetical protein
MSACYIRFVIIDSNLPVSWRTRPRGFAALMGLYESNYLRLEQLAGDLQHWHGSRHSRVPGDCELVLALLGRSPYTLELAMSYLLPSAAGGGPERVPDLRLRLYRDARMLEVPPAQQPAGAGSTRELGARWSRNLMLNKWLEYCAERGHSFLPPSRD